jgi:nucleotide-binding universal stress UspA family protein
MYRSILIPLDGSPFGEYALPYALDIARRTGAQLHLAHVSTVPPAEVGDVVDNELRTYEQAYLEGVVARLQPHCANPITTVQLEGPIASALHDYAVELKADLVVMTTHGRGPVSRFWLGSVADALVRQLPMPVLLVRPHEPMPDYAHPPTINHILIPLDGSVLAEQIMSYALEMGQLMEAEYTLLQVIPFMPPIYGTELYGAGWDEELQEQLRTSAQNYLDNIAAPLRAESLRVKTAVMHGIVADAILEYAQAQNVQAIALATHGRTGVRRWLLGGVADKVVRGAQMPVLLYRPQAEIAEG